MSLMDIHLPILLRLAADAPDQKALFERDLELARLRDAATAASTGSGRLLIVEGVPGAGKSSILTAAGAEAASRGMRVLGARGGPLERAAGFGVAQQLFEAEVVDAEPQRREQLFSGAAGLARQMLDVDGSDGGLIDPAQARHGLYWLLANLSEDRPLALLVDDAHWCDPPTLDWLVYLARRMERLPVLIVLAVGLGEPGSPTGTLDLLAAEPSSETLELSPLAVPGTASLLGSIHGEPVEDEFAAACHRWTGGNPSFVTEVSAELAAEGLPPGEEATRRLRSLAPERVSTVTLLRLRRLAAGAIALAGALAILGFESSLTRAGELGGLGDDEAVEAADTLVEARFVERAPRLPFVEPLIGRVIYDDLPPTKRAADHLRAAHLLHEDGAGPGVVAAQLLRADPGGDAWVVERLREAGTAQLGTGSASAAVPLLRRALEEPPPAAQVASIATALGLAESISGDPGGLDSLRGALAAAADPLARASSTLILARFLVFAGRGREAVAIAGRSLAELDESDVAGDDELRAQLEASLVTAAHSDGDLREVAIQHLAKVRPVAAEDSHTGRVVAAQCSYAAAASGGSAQEAVAFARTALGGRRLLDEAPMSPDLYLVPMSMLSVCDELDEAAARYDEALVLARESGLPLAYGSTAALKSLTATLRGRLAEGELLARDALRIAEESPALEAVAGFAGAHLALALVERGEAEEALALLGPDLENSASPAHTWSREALYAGGRALLASRRPAEALGLLRSAGRLSESFGIANPAFLPWRSSAALALHELGESDEAALLADEELARARAFGARRPLGIALRARGLVLGGSDGLDDLRESATVLESSPALLERAHSLVALGAALRRTGSRAEAREPLGIGHELADRCGAVPVAAHAREELGAAGARPRAQGRWSADALTISELRTCRMAAEGLSNPAIAQALFVTRGTVESHLHAAYRKLGIASRRELPDALAVYE